MNMQSLEKLIDERVAATMEKTLENHTKKWAGAVASKSSREFTETVYTNKDEINDSTNTTTRLSDGRELNMIIHRLKEDGTAPQSTLVIKELFEALEMKHDLTIPADRLGAKSQNKIRPIRVRMESFERKQEFMSSLWKLKHGPDKFKRISVTDDYTQEERQEIKRWVNEAKERTQAEDGYVWKVRGSPRSELRLIKMRI